MNKVIGRSLLISACSMMSYAANSQVLLSIIFGDKLNTDKTAFGLHLDYSWNQLDGMDKGKSLQSFNLGLFFNYHLNDHWFGNVECLAKYTRGEDKLPVYPLMNDTLNGQFAAGHYQRSIRYVSLPLTIQYVTSFGIFAELGPQVSLRTKAKDIFKADTEEGPIELGRDIRDDIHRWDIGWLAGVGYKVGKDKALSIGVRYNGSFSDAVKDLPGNQHHQQWGFYTNIPIGKKKAVEEATTATGN